MSADPRADEPVPAEAAGDSSPTRHTTVSVRAVSVALCFISTLSFGLIYYVFDRTRRGQIFDIAAAANVSEIERVPQVWANRVSDFASSWLLLIPVVALVGLGLWRKRSVLTAVLLGAGGVGMILSTVLKDQLPWRSFRLGDGVSWQAYNSLPSGRATAAMALGLAGIAMVTRGRGPIAFLATLFAFAVGVSAVVAGFHNPSDVIAAYVMVGGLYFAAIAAAAGRRRLRFGNPERVAAVASLVVGFAGLMVALLVLGRADPARLLVTMDDGRPVYQYIPVGSTTISVAWTVLVFAVCQMLAVAYFIVSRDRSQNHRDLQNDPDTPDLPLPLRP